jgi:hypothetical protein
MSGSIGLDQLRAEAAASNRTLCGLGTACWCRVPHYHANLPARAGVDAAVTCESVVFKPVYASDGQTRGPKPGTKPGPL